MSSKYYIGIDISKLTLDVALIKDNDVIRQDIIANTVNAVTDLLQVYKAEYKCKRSNTALCAERMGSYTSFLTEAAKKSKFSLFLEPPLEIKRSLGIQRGKTDALDAVRIARYLSKNIMLLREWKQPRLVIRRIQGLFFLRRTLIKLRTALSNSKNSALHFSANDTGRKKIKSYSISAEKGIKAAIERVEQELELIISNDENIKKQMELIMSVPYVGKILATKFIIQTNEFKNFSNAKTFACYCGVAPFRRQSGTSIKGKARVSFYANKEMKALLHIVSLRIIKNKKSFLAAYYERKVEEGKNKMSVLNAIRNKLVLRVFACIRGNKPFTEQIYYNIKQPE